MKKTATCYKCKYFGTCGDYRRTEPCSGYEKEISEEKAKAFWRNLMGTLWGDPERKYTSGIMTEERIAEIMGISVEKALEYLNACKDAGLTERQGGAWVV